MTVNQHQQLRLSEASDNVAHFLKLTDEYLMKSIQHRFAVYVAVSASVII